MYMAVHDYKLIDGCSNKNLKTYVATVYQINRAFNIHTNRNFIILMMSSPKVVVINNLEINFINSLSNNQKI